MSDPAPITQQVKIDADTKGVEDVARELERLQRLTQSSNATYKQAGDIDRDRAHHMKLVEDRLRDLVAAEERYARTVREGNQVGEEEKRLSAERQKEIDRYSRSLAALEDEQEKVNRATRAATPRCHARRRTSSSTNR